jgi:PAS domain S-box-containing protein
MRKDGQIIDVSLTVSPIKDTSGKITGASSIVRNISERKLAEEALEKSKSLLESVFNSTQDLILVVDRELRVLMSNWKSPLYAGCTEFPINSHCYEAFINRETPCEPCHALGVFNTGKPILTEYYNQYTKLFKEVSAYPIFDDNNHVIMVAEHVRDITDRKRAEEDLKNSEAKYRLLADNVRDVIFVLDMNLNYTYVSPSTKILRGYEPEEVMKQPPSKALTPSSWDLVTKTIAEAMELEKEHREINIARTLQLEMMRKDGTTVWTEVNISVIRNENQQPVGILGVTRDITERKRVSEALLESEEQYRLVVENAKESIIIIQDTKIVFVNNAAIDMSGYPKETLISKSFADFIHPDDRDKVILQNIKRLKGEKIPPVYSFRVISQDGTVIWYEINAVVIQWKGKPATLNFLNNITERKRAEEELQQTLDSLKKAVSTTIQVLVTAVESRDPYTAGHQLRVADLARTIAMEMGFSQEKIEGIHMAGSIHDIGKLSIPAEILVKPTKLTNIEFSLIKEHSKSGYEMLKDVESPWPLAQIVYQHHERMNGTGYPRNLKGNEILMEARILAVADVVEAMASHRPYRPGLGIDVALAEIEKYKGIFYDNTVADACLRLFREKGYQLT